jgi:hypothetical protein
VVALISGLNQVRDPWGDVVNDCCAGSEPAGPVPDGGGAARRPPA